MENKLKKGDSIRCHDQEEAGTVADMLCHLGIEWEFCYEKDGKRGIWIDILEDEKHGN